MSKIIRDPLWNNIRVDPLALQLVDTPAFQRLRYVRQLGLAHLVYPGATHSRFEHALGAYHLARRTLANLAERGALAGVTEDQRAIVVAAALLHDLGHYPFSHALEEIGAPHHEVVARPLVMEGDIAAILAGALGADAPARVFALIRGLSQDPLQGLISGSADLDKIEYLKRDALMCGVPYGEIDVDRLLDSLVVVDDPVSGRARIGLLEKGLSALESLLFAKYQMYRNVYWHHSVRSATAMYKRLVEAAIDVGALEARALAAFTDEGLLHHLEAAAPSPMLARLRERRLFKRAVECPAAEVGDAADWIAVDRGLAVAVENTLAAELGLAVGDILLDYPAKTEMLGLDLPLVRRDGDVRRLTARSLEGAINLPTLSEQLYQSARWLRVFVARPRDIPRDRLLALVRRTPEEIRWHLGAGDRLLG